MGTAIDYIKDLVRPFAMRIAMTPRVQSASGRIAQFGGFSEWKRSHPCPELPERKALFEHVARAELGRGSINYLEFGVFRGETVRWWAEHNSEAASTFVGFDSFEGLPEEWAGKPVGTFSTGGEIPRIADPRVRFVKGWFSETVPDFMRQFTRSGRLVVHCDADLFSSTILVLSCIAPHLQKGDLLFFDEFADYMDEYRAFTVVTSAFGLKYTAIGHSPKWMQVGVRID